MIKPTNEQIFNLKFNAKSYDDITTTIVRFKQRLKSSDTLYNNPETGNPDYLRNFKKPHFDFVVKQDSVGKELVAAKNAAAKKLKDDLQIYPVYCEWLRDNVPGIGDVLAAKLILHYYYKFVPICKECGGDMIKKEAVDKKDPEKKINKMICSSCGKSAKGEGVFINKIEEKDFPNIGKWWSYMGRAIDPETGNMSKRTKGSQLNFSTSGRTLGYLIYQQFIKLKKGTSEYNTYLFERREKRLQTHPNISKGHNLAMAGNETVKLFLSHFWHVARTLDGLSTRVPYPIEYLGHTTIISPYRFDEAKYVKKAA